MARGVRKSPVEKLQGELEEVRRAISQYKECLETMKSREQELEDRIQLEEFKQVAEILKEREMSMEDLKEMLQADRDLTLTA